MNIIVTLLLDLNYCMYTYIYITINFAINQKRGHKIALLNLTRTERRHLKHSTVLSRIIVNMFRFRIYIYNQTFNKIWLVHLQIDVEPLAFSVAKSRSLITPLFSTVKSAYLLFELQEYSNS